MEKYEKQKKESEEEKNTIRKINASLLNHKRDLQNKLKKRLEQLKIIF